MKDVSLVPMRSSNTNTSILSFVFPDSPSLVYPYLRYNRECNFQIKINIKTQNLLLEIFKIQVGEIILPYVADRFLSIGWVSTLPDQNLQEKLFSFSIHFQNHL